VLLTVQVISQLLANVCQATCPNRMPTLPGMLTLPAGMLCCLMCHQCILSWFSDSCVSCSLPVILACGMTIHSAYTPSCGPDKTAMCQGALTVSLYKLSIYVYLAGRGSGGGFPTSAGTAVAHRVSGCTVQAAYVAAAPRFVKPPVPDLSCMRSSNHQCGRLLGVWLSGIKQPWQLLASCWPCRCRLCHLYMCIMISVQQHLRAVALTVESPAVQQHMWCC
jgi:hypothetical protein